jgi:hypothetical protein
MVAVLDSSAHEPRDILLGLGFRMGLQPDDSEEMREDTLQEDMAVEK